ncbi:MAG: hypothetical protein PHT62_00745 [Desulfotomaculaceae bacterium]|nr:hypothetical protein [Desulfotomaculaceae bacterium]
MEYLVWAVVLWLLVFTLVPFDRFKLLWPVVVIATLLLFAMNFTFIQLGYYHFTKSAPAIFGVPLFVLVGGAGGGVLLMNWMQRNSFYKMLLVLVFSGLLVLATEVFIRTGAFEMQNGFNQILHYFINVAGLSILVWLSLAVTGEEIIYEGRKAKIF